MLKPWVVKNSEKLFSRKKRNSILTIQGTFRSTGTQKIFQKKITPKGKVEEDLLWSGGPSHLQENFNYNLSVVDKKQQIMWRGLIIYLSHKKGVD